MIFIGKRRSLLFRFLLLKNRKRNILLLKFVGIIPRIFDPMYDILIKQSVPCGVGYVQMMKDLSIDTDTALVTGNAINLRFLFKVFADLTEKDLPFIRDRRLYAAYVECLKANRQEQARLSNGCIDYCAVNEFFKNAANALNDILN